MLDTSHSTKENPELTKYQTLLLQRLHRLICHYRLGGSNLPSGLASTSQVSLLRWVKGAFEDCCDSDLGDAATLLLRQFGIGAR